MLHSQSEGTAIGLLPEEALFQGLPSDMDLETEEVLIVNPSLGQDFVLSIASGNNGLERVFVGANNRNEFRCHSCRSFDCQHCIRVQQWVQTQDGNAMELCEVFESFSLRSAEQQRSVQPEQPSGLPISCLRIPPRYCSELLAARALGEGAPPLLPDADLAPQYSRQNVRCLHVGAGRFFHDDSPSMCAAGMVHLVPGLHGQCTKCRSPWAKQDPVQAGWVAAKGTLYGLSGCITATMYHRRCTNR